MGACNVAVASELKVNNTSIIKSEHLHGTDSCNGTGGKAEISMTNKHVI